MVPIRLFTDEDVYGAVAIALRNSGYDAISTPEANRLGENDEAQLVWATSENRVLVTFNVGHFAKLHRDWMERDRSHAGIVVSAQRQIGDILGRLFHLARSLERDVMGNRLEFLGDW